MLLASALEINSKHEETCDDAELNDQSSFEEITSHVLLAFGKTCVGTIGCAVAIQCLHNSGDCSEGCQNTAWVYWRVVRHIVQYASQDNVVRKFIKRPILVRVKFVQVDSERQCLRCSIDQTYAGDKDVNIAVVESAYLAHDVASSEHEGSPWEKSGEPPGLVTTLERVS